MSRLVPFPPSANPREPRLAVPDGAWGPHFRFYGEMLARDVKKWAEYIRLARIGKQ